MQEIFVFWFLSFLQLVGKIKNVMLPLSINNMVLLLWKTVKNSNIQLTDISL